MNKYKNKKVTIDNITFDSRREARRYEELKLMEKAGLISNLVLQPRYEILKGFKRRGKTHRKIEYIADFKYFDNERKLEIIEDVKGFNTRVFDIKMKLFLYQLDDSKIFALLKKDKIIEY